MSFVDKKEIRCVCGKIFSSRIVITVNVGQDEFYKEVILNGQFNIVQCPECKKMLYVEVPFFYLEPAESIVIYVFPKSYEQEKEKYISQANDNFKLAISSIEEIENKPQEYFLKVMFGIEELVDFLLLQKEEREEMDLLLQIAKDMELKIIELPAGKAKQKSFISKLPSVNKPIFDDVLIGLERVVKKYSQLKIYKSLLDKINSDKIFKQELKELIELVK